MFETADPKQKFFVANGIKIYPDSLQILTRLYQPLIGAVGVSLYQTLIYNYNPQMILSDSRGLYFLQEQMDCSLKAIFNSLHKLEAVGLVKTSLIENEVSKIIVFELLKVPTAKEFFATSLLTSLLREKVGQSAFAELSNFFASKAKMHKKMIQTGQDISASFFDVFRLPDAEAITPSAEVQAAAAANQVADVGPAQINEKTNIDWDFMRDRLRAYQISPSEVDHKKAEIISLMQIYGLNEQEFIDEALPTFHGSSELNLREISRVIAENYRSVQKRKEVKQKLAQNRKQPVTVKLSDQNQAILLEAKRKTPAEFLYYLKTRKGGFTTASENRVLNNLVNRGLPVDLINVLAYVCLEYDTVLTASLAEKIANDWLQNNIATPEQALAYVENRSKRPSRPNYTRSHGRRKENATDWSKNQPRVDPNVDLNSLNALFNDLDDQNNSQGK